MADWQPIVYDREAVIEYITVLRNGHEITRTTYRRVPHVGELIAWWDRKAYRVVAVEEREQANWHERTVQAWEQADRPDPYTWDGRERAVRLQPADNPAAKARGYGLYPWASNTQWWPLREQYPTCNDCRLIWPCPCDERTDQARKAMKELDRLGGIMPGCCWACNEPVTGRHHSVLFDGENLLLPGAGPVVFHTSHSRKAHRGTCRGQAEEYEQKWVAAAPGRLVRLRCDGILYRHVSGSECTLGDVCPGMDATHAKYGHCSTLMYVGRWEVGTEPVPAPGPATNCGERGCRGPKVPADSGVLTEAA